MTKYDKYGKSIVRLRLFVNEFVDIAGRMGYIFCSSFQENIYMSEISAAERSNAMSTAEKNPQNTTPGRETAGRSETVSACLRAWMEETGTSVAGLTRQMEYKSKTTVMRVLQENCAARSLRNFTEALRPLLDDEWAERFARAMVTEETGLTRVELYDVIRSRMFPALAPEESLPEIVLPEHIRTRIREDGGTVLIAGCPGLVSFPLTDTLKSLNPALSVVHYMARPDLLTFPPLLNGLLSRIGMNGYDAVLLHSTLSVREGLPWNIAIYLSTKPENSAVLLPDGRGGRACCADAPDAAAGLAGRLRALLGVPLYHTEELMKGNEYVRFLQETCKLEAGKRLVAMKPTPGLQMIPAKEVEAAFSDFLSENFDPVIASKNSLVHIQKQRIENFYHRNKKTLLLLCGEAMDRFARDGMLTDHFFFLRPFLPAERVRTLQALKTFSQEKQNTVRLLREDVWDISFEAYEGKGVLLYPSATSYHSDEGAYRELFLPGQEFFELFAAFAETFAETGVKSAAEDLEALTRTAEKSAPEG